MDSSELQKLAEKSRSMREAGITLLLASVILGLFIFIPRTFSHPAPAAVTQATTTAPDAFANVQTNAEAAIVYDLATGQTLYAKNADAQLPLASLTKLLTVYAAFAELSPTTPIIIPSEAAQLDLPRAFNVGQSFTLADLARLTLTASLNDGAAAIASATAERENTTTNVALANAASALSLSQTYAVNGSGLDVNASISGGYGSAYDLARLAGALVKLAPDVALATTAGSASAVSLGGTAYTVKNTDPIVGTIPRLLLSKTGFTDLAGGNLALVFDAGIGHPIAVIVLGSSKKDRFTDGNALVAATLAHFAGVASL
jgi:D-alanyl-D-alanine endopeptidase (penicillin-binding protein 7)